jgi:glucose/arabinose dehydrogenase
LEQKFLKYAGILLSLPLLWCFCRDSNRNLDIFKYDVEVVFPSLTFVRPVDFQTVPDNSGLVFVVEQHGIINVFINSFQTDQKNIFLDIRSKVKQTGNEEGLLGMSFHPDYQSNNYFYLNYTAASPNRTVIARYQTNPNDSMRAIFESERIIMEIPQPFTNHNGGQLQFGPDGYLYIATGDGGSAGDPQNNAQNLLSLLGKILRIDVDNATAEEGYAIPSDNPFIRDSTGVLKEIYAYGLRNPWRFSFDPADGRLWAADVGQNAYEEIDIIESGGNYGWNFKEGFHTFRATPDNSILELIDPVWEYNHNVGASITGGYVYRGSRLAELSGAYIYADFISGRLWSLRYDGNNAPHNQLLLKSGLNISAFGIDLNNELYICAFDGKIYRLKSNTDN